MSAPSVDTKKNVSRVDIGGRGVSVASLGFVESIGTTL